MNPRRKQRVAELVRDASSRIIQKDFTARLPAMVTVMRVEMTDDLKNARIFISLYGTDEEKKVSLEILRKALKYIRRQLGGAIKIRHLPFLTFIEDSSLEHAFKIEALLNKLKEGNESSETAGGG
ncbi:30S ribosome-binding factor RbfA [candidate division KSB1 bacterium]